MRVLGIDPGLNITGYGILDNSIGVPKIVEAGAIKTSKSKSTEFRLKQISESLGEIINLHSPESVAVEDLYSHYDHPKTAIIMGHARGVVFLKAAESNLPVFTYASTRVKKSLTGNGRASKSQVQKMILITFGIKKLPEPTDVADALAIALCHCRNHLHPSLAGVM